MNWRDSFYSPRAIEPASSTMLWSKGIGQSCDFSGPDRYRRGATESCQLESFFREHYAGAHGLVWVRLSTLSRDGMPCDLDNFVRGALPTIRKPFALITTDGDASVPSELPASTVSALLDCPWLVSWHSQNYDGTRHAKLAPFPIGLDLHTQRRPRQLAAQLRAVREGRPPHDQRPLRVFCDLNISDHSDARKQAVAALRHCDHVDFLEARLSQSAIWERYAQYSFVMSAAGNGLDCHRTWELLYLGCIVITKTSSLDPLFEGLPVVIVRNWEEVRGKANLTNWLRTYGSLTDNDLVWKRLSPEHYLEPARAALRSAPAAVSR